MTIWDVDYLPLMSRPVRDETHLWFESFSLCREHLTEYCAGIERRNELSRRVSKLHKAYRQKKRGW